MCERTPPVFLHHHPDVCTCYVLVCTTGWFNSLAGVVKRRFSSYVKMHLGAGPGESGGGGGTSSPPDGGCRERPRGGGARNVTEINKPHYRSVSANAAVSQYGYNAMARAADGSGVTSKMQAPSPHVLGGGTDRRHRSPDPPPRSVVDFLFAK